MRLSLSENVYCALRAAALDRGMELAALAEIMIRESLVERGYLCRKGDTTWRCEG